MLYPDLSLITTGQNTGQNTQYAAAGPPNPAGVQPGTVVSVAGPINPPPIVAPSYPGAYQQQQQHTITPGGHQVQFKQPWYRIS